MTYDGGVGGGAPESRMSIGDEADAGGVYQKLPQRDGSVAVAMENGGVGELTVLLEAETETPKRRCCLVCKWMKMVLLCLFFGVIAVVSVKWIGPFVMDKVSTYSLSLFL